MDPSKPAPSLNGLLKMGNNVKVYHLPSYVKYDLRHNQDGSRTFNPLSLSRLSANLAVANTDPKDVQRQVPYLTQYLCILHILVNCKRWLAIFTNLVNLF